MHLAFPGKHNLLLYYCPSTFLPPYIRLSVMLNRIVYSPFLDRGWQLSACSHHAEEVFAMGDASRGVAGSA